jgi:hypothetical protein
MTGVLGSIGVAPIDPNAPPLALSGIFSRHGRSHRDGCRRCDRCDCIHRLHHRLSDGIPLDNLLSCLPPAAPHRPPHSSRWRLGRCSSRLAFGRTPDPVRPNRRPARALRLGRLGRIEARMSRASPQSDTSSPRPSSVALKSPAGHSDTSDGGSSSPGGFASPAATPLASSRVRGSDGSVPANAGLSLSASFWLDRVSCARSPSWDEMRTSVASVCMDP